uniref:Rho-GAP domain-containing protein n=1 Tax=Pavo cristatus TaxID=9049 RepID=A0A8C9L9R4_PAVCR
GHAALGMFTEGLFSMRFDELKAAYDREESPNLEEYEPNTVASLLKQYLRELPENLLTKELMPRFEDACGKSTEAEKVQECQRLLKELPECNHLLISWLIVRYSCDNCKSIPQGTQRDIDRPGSGRCVCSMA